MPIYAYRCESCGHQQDVLQKLSDAPLSVCTSCGAAAFKKQVTAAGFQLKGSGWYVTDFKNNGATATKASDASGKEESGKDASGKEGPGKEGSGKDEKAATPASAPVTPTPTASDGASKPAASAATSVVSGSSASSAG